MVQNLLKKPPEQPLLPPDTSGVKQAAVAAPAVLADTSGSKQAAAVAANPAAGAAKVEKRKVFSIELGEVGGGGGVGKSEATEERTEAKATQSVLTELSSRFDRWYRYLLCGTFHTVLYRYSRYRYLGRYLRYRLLGLRVIYRGNINNVEDTVWDFPPRTAFLQSGLIS